MRFKMSKTSKMSQISKIPKMCSPTLETRQLHFLSDFTISSYLFHQHYISTNLHFHEFFWFTNRQIWIFSYQVLDRKSRDYRIELDE